MLYVIFTTYKTTEHSFVHIKHAFLVDFETFILLFIFIQLLTRVNYVYASSPSFFCLLQQLKHLVRYFFVFALFHFVANTGFLFSTTLV